jgi:hypothetical protein
MSRNKRILESTTISCTKEQDRVKTQKFFERKIKTNHEKFYDSIILEN